MTEIDEDDDLDVDADDTEEFDPLDGEMHALRQFDDSYDPDLDEPKDHAADLVEVSDDDDDEGRRAAVSSDLSWMLDDLVKMDDLTS